MKKLILIATLLLTLGIAFGQEQRLIYEKSAEDVLRWHELYERMRTGTPPTAPVVNVAEFEPSQGVLIAYPQYQGFGIPYTLIAQMAEIVPVTIAIIAFLSGRRRHPTATPASPEDTASHRPAKKHQK